MILVALLPGGWYGHKFNSRVGGARSVSKTLEHSTYNIQVSMAKLTIMLNIFWILVAIIYGE